MAVLTFLYVVACIAAESQSQLWQGHDVEPRTYVCLSVPFFAMPAQHPAMLHP